MSHTFDPTVLREYDIRGIIGETLGADDARAIGRTFGSMLREQGGSRVAVGYDGRRSSPMLEHALVEGLTASGCDTVRIGLGATPMLYYAEASDEDIHGGIQITGSHNPPNYNGFKMVFQGRPFFGSDIQELGRRSEAGEWTDGAGDVEKRDILDEYVERMVQAIDGIDRSVLAGMRIGWDAGNGAAGPALEKLVEKLPGEHHLLFTEVDGGFPNHHPDPTVEENLADLRALVAGERGVRQGWHRVCVALVFGLEGEFEPQKTPRGISGRDQDQPVLCGPGVAGESIHQPGPHVLSGEAEKTVGHLGGAGVACSVGAARDEDLRLQRLERGLVHPGPIRRAQGLDVRGAGEVLAGVSTAKEEEGD